MIEIGRCDKVIKHCEQCGYYREMEPNVIGAEESRCGNLHVEIYVDPPTQYRTTDPYGIPNWCPLPLVYRER